MNIEILTIFPTIMSVILACVTLFMLWKIYKKFLKIKYVKSFVDYVAVLEYNMNKAYEIIHKDRILVYSLDAQRVRDEDFSAITHDFANLVIKIIGPTLHSEFVTLFGDEETFIFNLIEYFNTRYEEDEIRKQSLEEISNDNQSEEMVNYEPAP